MNFADPSRPSPDIAIKKVLFRTWNRNETKIIFSVQQLGYTLSCCRTRKRASECSRPSVLQLGQSSIVALHGTENFQRRTIFSLLSHATQRTTLNRSTAICFRLFRYFRSFVNLFTFFPSVAALLLVNWFCFLCSMRMNACSIINERKWRRERERASTWIEVKCAQQRTWYSLAHIILYGSVIRDGNCMILLNDCVFSWLLSTTAISWTIILMTIIVGVIPCTHTHMIN